jgi:flagellar basal-body rod modification protein FlgD
MPDPISPVVGTLPSATTSATPASNSTSPRNQMGEDTFLKLLVAQMQYQDPMNPTDGTQMIAQTAQFTMVEKLNQIATQNQQLLTSQSVLGASSLIGREVKYLDSNNQPATGVVTSASFGSSGVVLKVGKADVPIAMVQEVSAPTS